MRVITVNQPAIYPRIHLFDRAAVADRYVFLGSAQFTRRTTEQSVMAFADGLLRVPVAHAGRFAIDETRFTADERWARKSIARLQHLYGKLPGYSKWSEHVGDTFRRCAAGATVGEIGRETFMLGLEVFGIEVETVEDCEICEPIEGAPSKWMQELTRLSEGEFYYCGGAAVDAYLDADDWQRAGIRHAAQEWTPPDYAADIPRNLSMLDVMFRGDDAIAMLREDFAEARARAEKSWESES